MGANEFHSRTVRENNENLYASVRVVIAVKAVPSEERVTLVGCLTLSTEIATFHTQPCQTGLSEHLFCVMKGFSNPNQP